MTLTYRIPIDNFPLLIVLTNTVPYESTNAIIAGETIKTQTLIT